MYIEYFVLTLHSQEIALKNTPYFVVFIALFTLVCTAFPAYAQDSGGYFSNWFPRVDKTQAEQPHWITPLYTTTPRLEEEFRADIVWTPTPRGNNLNYVNGKGLELIP